MDLGRRGQSRTGGRTANPGREEAPRRSLEGQREDHMGRPEWPWGGHEGARRGRGSKQAGRSNGWECRPQWKEAPGTDLGSLQSPGKVDTQDICLSLLALLHFGTAV